MGRLEWNLAWNNKAWGNFWNKQSSVRYFSETRRFRGKKRDNKIITTTDNKRISKKVPGSE